MYEVEFGRLDFYLLSLGRLSVIQELEVFP